MKRLTLSLIVVLCSILGIQAQQTVTLPYFQDFASLSAGSLTSSNNSSTQVSDLPDGIASVVKGYQAGGVLKLGSSSEVGSFSTFPFVVESTQMVRVAMKVAPWTAASSRKPVKLLVSYGSQTDTVDVAALDHDWPIEATDFVLVISEFQAETTATGLSVSSMAETVCEKRVFVDDFKLSVMGAGAPLNEGFEDTEFPPVGWTTVNVSGNNTFSRTTINAPIGTGSAYINYELYGHENWLITPILQPVAGQNFVFSIKCTFTYSGTDVNVRVSTSGNQPSDFEATPLLAIASSTDFQDYWQTYSVDMSNYVGQSIYLAFQIIDDYGAAIMIDNVGGVNMSSVVCSRPENLRAEYVTEDAAGFAWSYVDGAASYVFEYATSDDFSTGLVSQVVTDTTIAITGLQPSTKYYYRVKSDCLGGDYSMTNSGYIRTSCVAINPLDWSESFANSDEQNFPLCWSSTLGCTASGTTYPQISTTLRQDTVGGSLILRDFPLYCGTNGLIVAMPEPATSLSGSELSLWLYRPTNSNYYENICSFVVGLMTDPQDATTFEPLSDITPDVADTWIEKFIDLSAATDEQKYVAFKLNYTGDMASGSADMYIDNISLHAIPTCAMPQHLQVAEEETLNRVGIVTWEATGDESQWILEYKEQASTEWIRHEISGTPIDTLRGIRANKKHDLRVKAVCSDGSESNWLTTLYTSGCWEVFVGWTENFVSTDTTNYSSIGCWHIVEGGWVVYETQYPNGNTTGYLDQNSISLRFNTSLPNIKVQSVATPAISGDLSGAQLEFAAKRTYMDDGVEFFVASMPTPDDSVYTELQTIPVTNTWASYIVPLTNITPGHTSIVLGIRTDSVTTQANSNWYIDNVSVKPIPSCHKPTQLAIDSIAATQVGISWQPGDVETQWVV